MRLLTMIFCMLAGMSACSPRTSNDTTKNYDTPMKFETPQWARQTSIYEVNVRQYTPAGTFRAFMSELPRLRDMGVGTLWFMPITPIAEMNRKGTLGSYYACSDYTSINPEFGTLEDFKELVKQAHELGMKVIIDWVANHTGWGHRWTTEHPDYYLRDSATGDFKIASGMDDIIELNFTNPALRTAMIDAMRFWVEECDIDGSMPSCHYSGSVNTTSWISLSTRRCLMLAIPGRGCIALKIFISSTDSSIHCCRSLIDMMD
jgi:glycosidase